MSRPENGRLRALFFTAQSTWIRLSRGTTLGVRGIVVGAGGGEGAAAGAAPDPGADPGADTAGAAGARSVLLVRHSYLPGWYLPGGGVDPGETAAEALAREVREETGIALTAPPRLLGLAFNRPMAARDHVALFEVAAGGWRRAAPFRPGAEIREARFFPLGDLPIDLSAATRRRLDEWIEGRPPAEVW